MGRATCRFGGNEVEFHLKMVLKSKYKRIFVNGQRRIEMVVKVKSFPLKKF